MVQQGFAEWGTDFNFGVGGAGVGARREQWGVAVGKGWVAGGKGVEDVSARDRGEKIATLWPHEGRPLLALARENLVVAEAQDLACASKTWKTSLWRCPQRDATLCARQPRAISVQGEGDGGWSSGAGLAWGRGAGKSRAELACARGAGRAEPAAGSYRRIEPSDVGVRVRHDPQLDG